VVKVRTTSRWMTATLAALVVGAALPAGLHAQLAINRSNEKLLILAPEAPKPSDTTFTLQVADAIRDAMTSKFRYRLGIITTKATCELLQKSGYSCASDSQAEQISRYLSATGYLQGWMQPGSDSLRFAFRLVDVAGSGLSGWFHVAVAKTATPDDIGQLVADNMDNQVKAAEDARGCMDKLGSSDFKSARDKASHAFEYYPDHPSAARCLALVYEAQQAPIDSQIAALQRAARGDSLNFRIWEELTRHYFQANDSAKALGAMETELHLKPDDQRLRLGVAAGEMGQKRYQDAVVNLDTILQRQPNDMQILRLKERACLDGSLWPCAIDALTTEFAADSGLATDTVFYAKIFGAAQSANDTTAMLKWSALAIKHLPNSLRMWQARATALSTAGKRDSLMAAYDRMLQLDSSQVSVALAEAQMLLDSTLVVDTGVPLDTARMARADTLMRFILRQNPDTSTRMAIAVLYYTPPSKMVPLRMHLPLATQWLEESLSNDVQHKLTKPANFFLGLGYAFQVFNLDPEVRKSKSCSMVDVEMSLVKKAIAAMKIGGSVSPTTTNQIMPYLQQLDEKVLPTYKPAFKCK
jgi:tetratricopeptide (TPR) repeat protein